MRSASARGNPNHDSCRAMGFAHRPGGRPLSQMNLSRGLARAFFETLRRASSSTTTPRRIGDDRGARRRRRCTTTPEAPAGAGLGRLPEVVQVGPPQADRRAPCRLCPRIRVALPRGGPHVGRGPAGAPPSSGPASGPAEFRKPPVTEGERGQRATAATEAKRQGSQTAPTRCSAPKGTEKALHFGRAFLKMLGSGEGIRTPDLRVMSPTSCHCSTPRWGGGVAVRN